MTLFLDLDREDTKNWLIKYLERKHFDFLINSFGTVVINNLRSIDFDGGSITFTNKQLEYHNIFIERIKSFEIRGE